MTRKEETQQAAKECKTDNIFRPTESPVYYSFIAGAEWADKTMIDKACEWLKENASDYIVYSLGPVDYDYRSLVDDFRKAMEE